MKKSEQVLLHAPTKRLQRYVDRLCADLPDRLVVQLTDVALWCSWRGWSPALTRLDEEVAFPLHVDRAQVERDAGRVAWKAIASSSLQTEFKKWSTAQRERYASAAALGLVHPDGRLDDLEFDRMVVDRTLLRMFEADGIDVVSAAATAAGGHHAGGEGFLPELILVRHHADYIYITHDGLAPPTISMPFPLGPGSYDGRHLQVPGWIPLTLAASAAGRRLGKIVVTGWAEIDARRIERVELHGKAVKDPRYPWLDPVTRYILESDAITLRDAGEAGLTGCHRGGGDRT